MKRPLFALVLALFAFAACGNDSDDGSGSAGAANTGGASGDGSAGCDGPEDCGGNACCGNLTAGFSCSAASTCQTGVQRCHTVDDCPSGKLCIPVTVEGVPTDVCGTP